MRSDGHRFPMMWLTEEAIVDPGPSLSRGNVGDRRGPPNLWDPKI
jgi:hypothetical protein